MIQDIDNFNNGAGVYTIVHTASGRTYVGEALNIRLRWKSHFNLLKANKHENRFLQRSWNKYSVEAFEFKVFLIIPRKENESNYMLKKRLKRKENEILKYFPLNYNLESPSDRHEYLIPGEFSKLKMKKSAKQERNSPEGRARMKKVRLEAMANPTATLNHKLATKAAWQNPKIKASRIASFNRPEAKINRKEAAKLGWIKRKENLKNPEVAAKEALRIQKATESLRKTYSTPEKKKECAEISKNSWKVPGRKEKVSKSLKEFYKDPENRKLHSIRMKNAFKDKKPS